VRNLVVLAALIAGAIAAYLYFFRESPSQARDELRDAAHAAGAQVEKVADTVGRAVKDGASLASDLASKASARAGLAA
jgi:hypothetical protein